MYLSKEEIKKTDRVKRLNLINSITGIKPGNLIGSKSKEGTSNVAIFSSVVHLGSDPALLGFILRPHYDVRRDTFENIKETEVYTINHIHHQFVKKAHYTSAKFEKGKSEFDSCGLNEEYLEGFYAPFVQESKVKLGMQLVDMIPIPANDTMMIVGEIQHLILPDTVVKENGRVEIGAAGNVGIAGLNQYYLLKKLAEFPYARVHEVPEFS